MTKPKFWLVSAIDDDPVQCQSYDSAVDLAVAVRDLIEGNESRHVYAFCFHGERCPITKGPERHLIVPHHDPSHYALFPHPGEIREVDGDGQLCKGPSGSPDVGYQTLTQLAPAAPVYEPELLDEDEPDDQSESLLTEPEEAEIES